MVTKPRSASAFRRIISMLNACCVEAACIGLNPDCMGCAGAHNRVIRPREPDCASRFPPRTCLHIEQGHACCLFFAPRVVSAKTLF